MKALEMEDDEIERFLDEADLPLRATSTTNGRVLERKSSSLLASFCPTSSVSKVVAALFVVVTVVLLTFSAESGIPPDDGEPTVAPPPPPPVKTPTSQNNPPAPSTSKTPPAPAPVPAPVPVPVPAPVPAPTPVTPNDEDKKSDGDESTTKNDLAYSKVSKFPPDLEALAADAETKTAQIEQWGKWKFFDGEEDGRPAGDYCAHYENRDVPGDEFPDAAWQADAVFVNHLIDAAEQLVGRAKESIFSEYGHGKPLPPEMLVERTKGFKWTPIDLAAADVTEPPEAFRPGGNRGNGGWTSKKSQQGLARRLLHAIMTNDNFTVVVAGDAKAAGHGGNHFHQSYAAQFHRVLRPILARVGVKLVTRNMSAGPSHSTIQSALGFRDLYGDDIDLVIWDSSSTEDSDDNARENLDLFLRQALLSGKTKVPQIWVGANNAFDVLKELHNQVGAAVGEFGTGMDGVTVTESADQAKELPFVVRYVKCSESAAASNVCTESERFCARCWIPRDDVDPTKAFTVEMVETPQILASGNMGWREHLLTSRVLIMAILDALQTAIQIFSEGTMGGPPLEDDYWHVTDYYNGMRDKLKGLDPDVGACANLKNRNLPSRICHTVMKGRGLNTPRYNPNESSLLSVVRPTSDGYKPANTETMAYEGPDVHNSCYDIPDGGVDVVSIVSNRRYLENVFPSFSQSSANGGVDLTSKETRDLGDAIVPGKGWEVMWEKPGTCDGQYDSICGRERSDACPLLGYHDSQGTLVGNEFSGWLVLDLPDLSEGIILLRMISGLDATDNPRTEGWSSVNNERRTKNVRDGSPYTERRALRDDQIPDDLIFEFAINGEVTSWDKKTLLEKRSRPQKMVELWTLLDDPDFAAKGKVELAIRLQGCGNRCTFGVPHVYWA